MKGASSLDAAMQLAEWYDATFSKQQHNPDPQNAGQAKGHCKGCNSCVLCSAACNTALHSTAPMCTATQHLTGITYT